jgi:AcrR family transcriptional regulator
MNRRDKQKAETFIDIMRSAEELFMRRGFEKTSMQQIAEHAGLTKGALYHHFISKEALLERICAEHSQVLLNAVSPVIEDRNTSCFLRIHRIMEINRRLGIADVSFVSEYLKTRHDESGFVLRKKLEKYNKDFYVRVLSPLLNEAKQKGECNFAASSDVLAVFIYKLEQGVNEEINIIFAERSGAEVENRIIDIMKTYVYALSRIIGANFEETAALIGLEESLQLYGEVFRARVKEK